MRGKLLEGHQGGAIEAERKDMMERWGDAEKETRVEIQREGPQRKLKEDRHRDWRHQQMAEGSRCVHPHL